MKISILHRVNYSAKSPDKPPGITKEKLCQYLGLNRKQSNSDPVVSNIIKAKDKLKRRSLRVRYLEIVKKTQDKLVNAAPKPETSPTTVVDVPASLIRLDKKVELKKQEKEPQKFTGIERIDYCKKSPKPDNVIDLDSSNKIPTTPQYEMKILAGVVPPKCSILLRRYKSEDDKEVPSKIQKPNVPVMKSPENLVDNQQAESPIEPKSIKLEIMKFPRRLETQSPPKLILIPRPRPLNMVVAQKPAVQQLAPALSSLPKGQIQQLPHIKGLQGFIVKPNLPRTSSAPAEGILMKQEAKLIKQLPPIVQVQPNISSQSLRIEEKKVIEQKFQEKKIHELKLQEKKLQVEEMVIQQPPAPIHQAKDQPANINKINNKINIIIKMDPQDKRRLKFNQVRSRKKDPPSPIKSPQKHVKTQTDQVLHLPEPERKPEKPIKVEKLDLITNCSTNNFLSSEAVQKVFFEHDILVVVQKQLISYFRYDKMKFLLTGVTIFNPIDKMERKLYDEEINVENNERLCFSENNSQNPILIEMRGKQKVLEPNMCPLLSLYCNIYYLDQDKLLFSCVNLDTVKR